MSTRANPTVIGVFVLGAVVLLVLALLAWGGTGLFRTRLDYVLFFDSSVIGLNNGAPVTFQGVKVGQVTDIQIRWGTPLVAVYISMEPDLLKGTPKAGAQAQIQQAVMERGLRAKLKMQSFVTGVLYVALEPAPDTPIVLRGLEKSPPELPTIPTDVEMWTAKLEKFAETIQRLPLEQMATTTAETLEEIKRTLESPELARTLRTAEAVVSDTRALVQKLDTQVGPLSSETRAALKATQAALADVPRLVQDAQRVVAKVDAKTDPLLDSIRSTSDTARATIEQAQVTLGGVDRTLDQESPLGYEAVQALRELREAARALRSLADYLERVPDAPLYGLRRPSGEAK
jgi:paraquat-inducible protein B